MENQTAGVVHQAFRTCFVEHRRDVSSGALCGGAAQRVCGRVERARGGGGRFGLARETVRKMLRYRRPPGYRRRSRSGVRSWTPSRGSLDQILREDQARPKKQTAHGQGGSASAYGAEYGFTGGDTIIKAYVREQRLSTQEMFVPLAHPPGDAQADFGESAGGDRRRRVQGALPGRRPPAQRRRVVQAFPAETTEAFCAGHNAAFRYFGGVPRRIVYDNTKLAVARSSGTAPASGRRSSASSSRTTYSTLASGRPGKGNDKGKVEGLGRLRRRNFFVPVPRFGSWDALNAYLARQCHERRGRRLRRHTETIGERFARDRAALLPLPPVPYDACDQRPTRVTSLSLVRYRRNDYSVPTAYGHRAVVVKGYVDEVVIVCGSDEIARHRRSYEREALIFEPRHYLALLERKTGAFDQAAPLAGWQLPDEFLRLRRLLEARLGKPGTREYVQVLRLLEDFRLDHVRGAVQDAVRLGAIGFDAVKHLVRCRLDHRPPHLDLAQYPHLPVARVATTAAANYLALLGAE